MLSANMFGTESPKEVVIVANETYSEIKSTILELQKITILIQSTFSNQ